MKSSVPPELDSTLTRLEHVITELSKKHNIPLIYFFLYRNNTNYDRTIDPNHPEFIKLLQYLKQNNITMGLHPSYYSSQNADLFFMTQIKMDRFIGTQRSNGFASMIKQMKWYALAFKAKMETV